MDIQRSASVAAAKRKRRIILSALAVIFIAGVTLGLSRLRPAAPSVERSTIWTDTVKRGPMIRQVRGLGTLVPVDIRSISALTDANVERRRILPGTQVKADTIIMDLSDPATEQAAQDAELQLKAAEADYKNLEVKVQSDLMTQRSNAATVSADYGDAKTKARIDSQLAKLGVISGQALESSEGHAQELATRNQIEEERVAINTKSVASQLAVQQAKIDELRALYELKKKQLDALHVRAGIDGVLTEVPVVEGQRVTAGTNIAKVVDPTHLKAELKIAETQSKDITFGQPASIDTHNGVIDGTVMRIDPAVINGTVTVDVKLDGHAAGERPDLSVDGTIDLDRLANVEYVGRPAFGQENSTVSMFKLDPDGKGATRVTVKLGRSSVNAVEILGGLNEGDQVILSDMSRWDNVDRIRLE
ncbi:MAG TPA: HlyD family efflux transporter periplasmic adaptor subunit [Terriglobales bacterium]|jgi:HlyD family secretion protein|nr:HlyD family efflux transporter periplasmic adaptor subunit [Terriglobales bacterium]